MPGVLVGFPALLVALAAGSLATVTAPRSPEGARAPVLSLGFHGSTLAAVPPAHDALTSFVEGSDGASTETASPLAVGPPTRDGDPPLSWSARWPRFSTPEYVASGALLASEVLLLTVVSTPDKTRFRGGALFDDAVRDALHADSLSGRRRASQASDYLYIGFGLFPLVVDAGIVAWGVHGSTEAAAQMALIDVQALLLSGVVAVATERTVGRERPSGQECPTDPSYDPSCGSGHLNVSFLSGHTAITFTSASLVCTHHGRLPLYGGGLADTAACVTGFGVATTTAILRIVADAHYTTDVLSAALVGVVSGYVLPSLLHYGFGDGDGEAETGRGRSLGSHTTLVAPIATNESIGLAVLGVF